MIIDFHTHIFPDKIAAGRDDLKLIAGVAPKGRDYIGKDLGAVTAVGYDLGVPMSQITN